MPRESHPCLTSSSEEDTPAADEFSEHSSFKPSMHKLIDTQNKTE